MHTWGVCGTASARRGSDRQQTALGCCVSTCSAEIWCETSCTKPRVMWSNGWVGKGSMLLKRTFERFVESSITRLWDSALETGTDNLLNYHTFGINLADYTNVDGKYRGMVCSCECYEKLEKKIFYVKRSLQLKLLQPWDSDKWSVRKGTCIKLLHTPT